MTPEEWTELEREHFEIISGHHDDMVMRNWFWLAVVAAIVIAVASAVTMTFEILYP